MLQQRPTVLRQLRLLAATGAIALLAACSTLDRGTPPQLERKSSWVVLPFANHTEPPLAGQRAEAIAQALPAAGCDYFGDYQGRVPSSPVLFVGFWTDKGTADAATLELLKTVKNKKIFLFGTAGFGGSAAYFQKILLRVQENLDAGNQVIGTFMCQGKMPLSVRQRYEKMKEQPNPAPNLDMLIANFDRALTHPDEQDLQRLQEAVCAVQM